MLNRYRQNLKVVGCEVFSYNTKVAVIDSEAGELKQLGWWSVTTQKHINYIGRELGLKVVRVDHLKIGWAVVNEILGDIKNRGL